jgi:hypothetical protein
MNPTCACGCGSPPREGKAFLHGHWSRTPAAKARFLARRTPGTGPNPSGLCQCECGSTTGIADRTSVDKGWVIGQPKRYINGHGARGRTGDAAPRWQGGRWLHKSGYIYRSAPNHPQANRDGYVYEHRLVMEEQIGRFLEPYERVHHINGVKTDNRPENLVVTTQSAHVRHHDPLTAWRAENPEAARAHARHAGTKGAQVRWYP